MGWEGTERAVEDELCAEIIRNYLLGTSFDFKLIQKNSAQPIQHKILRRQSRFPEKDFFLSTELNRFDYAIKALKDRNTLYIQDMTNIFLRFIDTPEKLRCAADEWLKEKELAVDLEGEITALLWNIHLIIQISSRHKNYIVDVLKLQNIDQYWKAP